MKGEMTSKFTFSRSEERGDQNGTRCCRARLRDGDQPDGVRNQVEGTAIQSLSRTLHEEVASDRARVTSRDWVGYPNLRFSEIPDSIDVVLVNGGSEYPAYDVRCSRGIVLGLVSAIGILHVERQAVDAVGFHCALAMGTRA